MTTTDQPAPLTPADVAAALGALPRQLHAEFDSLPVAALRWHPAPGEWCLLEAVGHLIEAEERGFAGRVRQMLQDDNPLFATWDAPAVARARRDCDRDPADLLGELETRRAESVRLVAGLSAADVERTGRHPAVGTLTMNDLLHEWVHHDRNHLRQALANGQAYVWPAMGNAQRFSRPG